MTQDQWESYHSRSTKDSLPGIVEKTFSKVGDEFFRTLVQSLAEDFGVSSAFVCERITDTGRFRAVSMFHQGKHIPTFSYDAEGTPCGEVAASCDSIFYAKGVASSFPKDEWLTHENIEGYFSIPYFSDSGKHLGHLGVMDVKPLSPTLQDSAILRLLTQRTGAEIKWLRAQRALENSEKQMRRLSEKLLHVEESERARISREVHDQLGQALTALKFELSAWKKNEAEGNAVSVSATQLNHVISQVDHTCESVRRISRELRPSLLDDLGLESALRWQAEQFQQVTGIGCECDCDIGTLPEDSKPLNTAIYRIAQESLTNISKHSGAQNVEIRIDRSADNVRLDICDDGKGFDPTEEIDPSGIGIIGMRERAAALGGTLLVGPNPRGKGTQVLALFPTHLVQGNLAAVPDVQ